MSALDPPMEPPAEPPMRVPPFPWRYSDTSGELTLGPAPVFVGYLVDANGRPLVSGQLWAGSAYVAEILRQAGEVLDLLCEVADPNGDEVPLDGTFGRVLLERGRPLHVRILKKLAEIGKARGR